MTFMITYCVTSKIFQMDKTYNKRGIHFETGTNRQTFARCGWCRKRRWGLRRWRRKIFLEVLWRIVMGSREDSVFETCMIVCLLFSGFPGFECNCWLISFALTVHLMVTQASGSVTAKQVEEATNFKPSINGLVDSWITEGGLLNKSLGGFGKVHLK